MTRHFAMDGLGQHETRGRQARAAPAEHGKRADERDAHHEQPEPSASQIPYDNVCRAPRSTKGGPKAARGRSSLVDRRAHPDPRPRRSRGSAKRESWIEVLARPPTPEPETQGDPTSACGPSTHFKDCRPFRGKKERNLSRSYSTNNYQPWMISYLIFKVQIIPKLFDSTLA